MCFVLGCGHCQHFAPTYDDISIELRDVVFAYKVNCERFGQLCNAQGVRAYPTVRFYPGATHVGQDIHNRQANYIVQWVTAQVDRLNERITHDEL